jgi:pyruvate/2-oxoglutarate dehydrogenase complex dihydrolipoamide acyltransferase (E2) component
MAVTDATIVEWMFQEGEWVERHQIVVVIETEKIRNDVEASVAGFVHILLGEGETAPVGTVIGILAESKEELKALQKEAPKKTATKVAEVAEVPRVETTPPKEAIAVRRREERIRISPVARKMAEEHVIDITEIVGTGPEGRITREDIENAIAAKEVARPVKLYEGRRMKAAIPLKGMRKAIAEHMHQSLSLAAQLTCMGEIDMTDVVKLRNDLLDQENVIGARITYTDILVLAISRALSNNPIINSSLIDNEIKLWEDINIGVAVALDEGLIVPVVKNADNKSLLEISQTVKTLTEKARERKLTVDEVTGGTFTLTNLGALGGGWSVETAIINQPESAILRTGAITDRVVVREGQIVVSPIMTYSLTYDHRVIDGAIAAKFIASITKLLENPSLLLV